MNFILYVINLSFSFSFCVGTEKVMSFSVFSSNHSNCPLKPLASFFLLWSGSQNYNNYERPHELMSCLLDYRYYAPHNSISLYNDNDLGSYNNFHPLKHVTKFCFPMFLFLFSCYFVKGKVPFFSQLVTFLTCILNVCTEYFHGVLTSAKIMFVCFLVSNEQFVNNK